VRKLLLKGVERLDEDGRHKMIDAIRVGDPNNEVLGAWLAKEHTGDVYLATDPAQAAKLLEHTIKLCLVDDAPEVRSLGRTLRRWRKEILAHHITGASNGPTEPLNLLVKKVKRCGHGFTNFENYRLPVLLHCGGIKWQAQPATTMRARLPQLVA